MSHNIMCSKSETFGKFTIRYDLVNCECGLSQFRDKWKESIDGLVIGSDGGRWTCAWYTIGEDCTVEQAQKEFDRDCEAFDVHVYASVYKGSVCLIDMEPLIGSDYNWDDQTSPEELLAYLIRDYGNQKELEQMATEELLKAIRELTE